MEAVCDLQYERAARWGSEYGVGVVTDDHTELVSCPEVQLVVVATPCYTHHRLALDAIRRGKHVLVMKPLTTTVEHAEELVYEAERQGVMLAVDHTFVYTGAVRKIRELIEHGELGEILYIDSVRINLGLFQPDVNVVWDLAPHDVSIIDFVLDGREPLEVSTIGAKHASSPTENIAYVTLRYSKELLAHVHVNWLAPAKVRQMIIGGSKKMVIYDDVEPSEKVRVYDKGVEISHENNGSADPEYAMFVQYRAGDMHAPKIGGREALAVEVDHLLECIRNGAKPVADGVAGLRVVQILSAAQQSVDAGGVPVQIAHQAPNRKSEARGR
jgi:predicted dehydrogenase